MRQIDFQPGAALLLGVLFFAFRPVELGALLIAAAVHELGHWLMLRILGAQVCAFAITMTGPVLRYEKASSWFEEVLVSLSGPAAGLLLWFVTLACWRMLSEISLFLSLLNLIPVLPLDGGRALRSLLAHFVGDSSAERFCNMLCVVLCGSLLFCGLYAAYSGFGITLAVFAAWLTALACQADGIDVK